MDTPRLVETVTVAFTLWGDGTVHASFNYRDVDPDNDLHWHHRYSGDETLECAVDDNARLLVAWAAVGRLGIGGKLLTLPQ